MWISVIMPVFNSGKTIQRAIESVLIQDDVELIIIDAGSTDETLSIIKKYSNQIAYWVSEKDRGYADALNKGIRHAKGEYVMMLAADDELIKNSIYKAKQSMHSDTEIWCGALIGHDIRGYSYIESDSNLNHLSSGCSLKHPATIFKKSVFEKYGWYDDSYKCSADWEIFMRFWKKGAIFQIESIAMVIFEKEGMSSKNTQLVLREAKKISEQYELEFSEEQIIHDMRPRLFGLQVVLARLKILPIIYKIAGAPDGCLDSKRLKAYLEK